MGIEWGAADDDADDDDDDIIAGIEIEETENGVLFYQVIRWMIMKRSHRSYRIPMFHMISKRR